MTVYSRFRASSRIALAIALSGGLALGMAAPAQAAKKKDEKAAQQGGQGDYSKEFRAAYQPFGEVVKVKGDMATLQAQLPALVAAASTADDKYTAGQMMYSIGNKIGDVAMQRQGVNMMLDSGSNLAGADKPGQIFAAARLAYDAKDWTTARTRAEQAVAAGYTGDADLLISEAYFGENQTAAGLEYIDRAIAKKVAAGAAIPEPWLKRAVAKSYEAKLTPQAVKYSGMFAQYYPSQTSWGDAVAIQRNLRNYEGQELLDLMRLARRAGALRTERDYVDYIEAVDARRLPGETQQVIAAGLQAGKLKSGDVFVSEANSVSSARLKADTADLPNLARDARGPNATVATLMAAGDAFLSYGKAAEAEEFYTRALAKPGVDTGRVLTRLGIAQLDLNKTAEAQATFAKVQGSRQPIAQLWSIYAAQAAKGTVAAK